MPKMRNVVVWTAAALVTIAMEVIGLDRAIRLRDELTIAPSCPVPIPAVVAPPAPAAPVPETVPQPAPTLPIRVLTVRQDAVVLEAGGRRHVLPGYPPPRSQHHRPGLTSAVVAPDGELVAIAGECRGESGVVVPVVPSCAPVFVRLYRVADGSHVRDLKMRWESTDDWRRPLAMAFDERTGRLAVLIQASWSDCMWEGEYVELLVYRLTDGARVAYRTFPDEKPQGARNVTFHEGEIHVLTAGPRGRQRVHVVRLPR